MDKKPLLIFPRPEKANRTIGKGRFGGSFHYPTKPEQLERIEPIISELEKVLIKKSIMLQHDIANAIPEMVLVLEIRGTIDDFFKAVKLTQGLEFLAEYEDDFEPDDLFFNKEDNIESTKQKIHGQVFLVMTNQTALKQLKNYWDLYKKESPFKQGTTKFKLLFGQLSDIRPYSIKDRIYDTGFADYLNGLKKESKKNIKFEIELFYRENYHIRNRVVNEIKILLNKHNGFIIENSIVEINEIRYHAFIAEAPIESFDDLTDNSNISFLQCEHIMFLRPVGQLAVAIPTFDDNLPDLEIKGKSESIGEPIIALLDGLPLAKHTLLEGRLIIDDADDFEKNYQSNERVHGTTMASLIIHGELDDINESPLTKPIYIRPIMKPDEEDTFNPRRQEIIPRDRLPIDLIHRSIKRMFDNKQNTSATAPTVKIVNLSIGDPVRPFHFNLSAWAKLLLC